MNQSHCRSREKREKKTGQPYVALHVTDHVIDHLSFIFQLFGKIAIDTIPPTEINSDNHFRNLPEALQVLFR